MSAFLSNGHVRSLFQERPQLAQPTHLQPKTAFSRLPPVHRAGLEGQQRVDFGAYGLPDLAAAKRRISDR